MKTALRLRIKRKAQQLTKTPTAIKKNSVKIKLKKNERKIEKIKEYFMVFKSVPSTEAILYNSTSRYVKINLI